LIEDLGPKRNLRLRFNPKTSGWIFKTTPLVVVRVEASGPVDVYLVPPGELPAFDRAVDFEFFQRSLDLREHLLYARLSEPFTLLVVNRSESVVAVWSDVRW
jgi:hypothetical protein